MALSPFEVLQRDREAANRFAAESSKARTKRLLERAQMELVQRLAQAGGAGSDSFTAAQMRVALVQVRETLRALTQGVLSEALDLGARGAERGVQSTVDYIGRAEAQHRGIARPLPFDTALMFDRVARGSRASILRRLGSDPNSPAGAGVLGRYGANVFSKFEQAMQQRLLQGKSWAEARGDLAAASPFLRGAPEFWTERILRTETMNAHGGAAQEALTQVESVVGQMLKILCATFDNRTASDSYAVHGQIRRPNEAFTSWYGPYMHPPNRPNDREVVVPHNMSWALPKNLEPMSDAQVAARWAQEGRKGSPPPRPLMSTVDRALIGKTSSPPMAAATPAPGQQQAASAVPAPPPPPVLAPEPAPPPPVFLVPPAPRAPLPTQDDYRQVNFRSSFNFENKDPLANFHATTESLFGRAFTDADLKALTGTDINIAGAQSETRIFSNTNGSGQHELRVEARWTTADQDEVGQLVRRYKTGPDGKTKVKHELFVLEDKYKGQGEGSKVIAQQLEQYRREGVSSVSLEAAWDGPYVWAKAGWHVSDEDAWQKMRQRYSDYVDSNAQKLGITPAAAKAMKQPKSVREIALGEFGDAKVGKDFLRTYYDAHGEVVPMELHVGSSDYETALKYFKR